MCIYVPGPRSNAPAPRARGITIQLGARPRDFLRNGCNWAAAAGGLAADLLLARQLSASSQKQATGCSQQQQSTCWPASQPAKLHTTSQAASQPPQTSTHTTPQGGGGEIHGPQIPSPNPNPQGGWGVMPRGRGGARLTWDIYIHLFKTSWLTPADRSQNLVPIR